MQEAPIHQSHVYGRIKILRTIFEKGHPRNIPVKLFQNLTRGFGEEDFLRISSCPYSARSPHSPEPCLWTDQNFTDIFWKGSPKEHSCEIISKSDERFLRRRFLKNYLNKRAKMALDCSPDLFWDCSTQFFFVAFRKEFTRISLRLYSARSLHSLIPCLLTDQNFKNNFEKGHSRNISMRLFQNLTDSFREDFLWFCLCSYSQVAPIHQNLVQGQI